VDLSTNDARLALAAKYAAKYALETAIVAAVCEQESAWNPFAIRWEPGFYNKYVVGMNLSDATEKQMRGVSFGLMQVMGQVARELGFQGRFLTQLCDPDIGVDVGCRKLASCFKSYNEPETALLSYNGDGNPDYGKQVLARVASYLPAQGDD
jgi:soluble lytic murein transglycosylase-like protein